MSLYNLSKVHQCLERLANITDPRHSRPAPYTDALLFPEHEYNELISIHCQFGRLRSTNLMIARLLYEGFEQDKFDVHNWDQFPPKHFKNIQETISSSVWTVVHLFGGRLGNEYLHLVNPEDRVIIYPTENALVDDISNLPEVELYLSTMSDLRINTENGAAEKILDNIEQIEVLTARIQTHIAFSIIEETENFESLPQSFQDYVTKMKRYDKEHALSNRQ